MKALGCRCTPALYRANMNLASLVAFVVLVCAGIAFGQAETADMVGTVTDASGAVVPGATVTATNTGTNISKATTTTGDGDYTFSLLQVGTYSIRVEAKGFKSFTAPSVPLSAGDRARVDAKLEVGDVSQTVEVSASVAPALQTDSSNIASLVTSQAVQDVPLNGRNFVKLVQLSPGVTIGAQNDLASGNRPADRRQTSEFTVNGQTTDLNNNMIDGMDNNDRLVGSIGVRPSVDAVQEISIQLNKYDASVGRTAGGVVNVITKSGTNDFHGSVYEFFRNAVLNTNPNYQFPASYTNGALNLSAYQGKPAFRQNQYGGSLGGPIKKDKTFFFVDYEGFSNALGLPLVATVPTTCMRGTKMVAMQASAEGISAPAVDCSQGNNTVLADPGNFSELTPISLFGGSSTTGAAKTGAVVPLSSQSAFAQTLFSLYPLPNSAGLTNNYSSNPARTQKAKTFDVKIDQHFSDKNSFSARYSKNSTNTLIPTNFPFVNVKKVDPYWTGGDLLVDPGGQSASFPGPSLQGQQNIALTYVHVFRANLLLDLKAAYLRLWQKANPPNFPNNITTALGQACDAVNCVNYGNQAASGLADFNITGYTGLGEATFLPVYNADNGFQEIATLTWNKGAHSMRFGVELIRRQSTSIQSTNPPGTFTFTGIYSGVAPGDFLQGLGVTGSRNNYLISPGYRTWEPSAYVQDDWRTTNWLTLNLGIRYDIFTPFTEIRGRISNWDPTSGLLMSPAIPGIQQSGRTALMKTPYLDIAPRFGFAATLPHNAVLRGGFGLTMYPQGTGTAQNTFKNAPFNFTFSCTTQNEAASNSPCAGPLNNGATAHYGPPATSQTSSVNQTGGISIANGLPVPVLDINNAIPPAVCTFTTNAAYNSTCPNNPYTVGIPAGIWRGYVDAVVEQFNLQLQKQFGANVVTIGYVGELGRHLGMTYSPNHISNSSQNGITPLATEYPWLAKTNITENFAPWGTSAYHSLQATFVRRFGNGLTVQANYTWAHNMSNTNAICLPTVSDSVLGYGSLPAYTNPCYYDNPGSPGSPTAVTDLQGGFFGVGNNGLNVPNRISGTVNYQLPLGKSMKGFLGVLVKGWTVNDAFSWQSGEPFTITTGVQPAGGSVGSGRPDQICGGKNGSQTLESWGVNPACFTLATANTYGNEHANQFFGPHQRNMDFSLNKDFPLNEKVRMQFRAEVFNLFNTPNFSAPSATSVAAFGPSANLNVPGQPADIQNPKNLSSLKLGAITSLNNNYNSRQIQFALKLLF